MFVFDQGGLAGGPRYLINFPTKRDWKSNSRVEDIQAGLSDLVRILLDRRIRSPLITASLGTLRFARFGSSCSRQRVLRAAATLPDPSEEVKGGPIWTTHQFRK